MSLETTSVGSFPKPPYLTRARTLHGKGEIPDGDLETLERRATKEWIAFQEEIGIDILVDGEQYRGDMATYFAENLEGCEISGLVRSYGNRYYKKPVVIDELARPKPITIAWWRWAQDQTTRPLKGMLTGPYTMMDWSFNEHYPSREDLALAFAKVLHQEAKDLERSGAKIIQIDEPALSARTDELDLVVKGLSDVTRGLEAKTITHTCYGNYDRVFPYFNRLPVDQIDLEMSNSGLDLLDRFRRTPLNKEIAFGVIDVHTHRVETVDDVRDRIERALQVFRPDQLYIDPDCGLKTRTVDEAKAKLRAMVEATRAVKSAHGLG